MVVKRHRASAPKKRTGCGTCKIRHKRCDEAKPICDSCKRTGRVCDGYVDPATGLRFGGHAGRASPFSGLAPRSLFANEEEAQGFRFFEIATELQLAAALQNHGWSPPLLQLSHQDPAICHAVIANGIMSKRYQINQVSTPDNPQANTLQQAALQQYGKAVACFRSQLGSSLKGNSHSLESAPACSVLFIMFEFMQGNVEGLLLHLKNASSLVAGVRQSPQKQPFLNLLALLEIVTGMWLNLNLPFSSISMHIPKLYIAQMPLTRYSNLETLYYDLSDIKNDFMIWRHAIVSAREDTVDLNNSYFIAKGQSIKSRLEIWHRKFVKVSPTKEDILTHRRSLLRANYLLTTLLVDAVHSQRWSNQPIPSCPDSPHLPNIQHFYEILDLTEAALEAGLSSSWYDTGAGEEPLVAPGLLPLFSFRHSFIQPLFYTAQNAPYVQICQRALQLLLRKPWREGAWDSFIMGSIARRSLGNCLPT